VGEGEADIVHKELSDTWAADGHGGDGSVGLGVVALGGTDARRDDARVDDVDAAKASTVATGELLVHLLHGSGDGHVTVLLVHVVRPRAGVVANGDAVVLDDVALALTDLRQQPVAVTSASKGRRAPRLTSRTASTSPVDFFILSMFFMKYLRSAKGRRARDERGRGVWKTTGLADGIDSPEAGLGRSGGLGEQAHAVDLGSRVGLRRLRGRGQ
jgi:hypothetical protein